MIRSAVTISLVDEAADGPFVFRRDLAAACREAQELGFDAVELFLPSPQAVDPARLRIVLNDHGLALAAVGTGAGWLRDRLHLTLGDAPSRVRARDFARSMVEFAGAFRAPAIIGAMQGRSSPEVPHFTALGYLADALEDLGETARPFGVPILLEPMNRYETDLINTLEGGTRLIQSIAGANVRLVADLFHMNIEEADSAAAIRSARGWVGHVHLADSNRRAPGAGQIAFAPIAEALHEVGFAGFASVQALPYPDPRFAATQAIHAFRGLFGRGGPAGPVSSSSGSRGPRGG